MTVESRIYDLKKKFNKDKHDKKNDNDKNTIYS